MKRYQLSKGSTDMSSLKLVECDVPEPGEGQVLIRMRAASLNYRDHAIVTGNYFGGVLKRDTVPLSDGAGEVEAVGPGVDRFAPGSRPSVRHSTACYRNTSSSIRTASCPSPGTSASRKPLACPVPASQPGTH